MSIHLHILGTSSSRPAKGRAVSGSWLDLPNGQLVVDCGEGFQHRLMDHNAILKEHAITPRFKPARLQAILLTHGHLDHTWGVLPWLQTMALDGRNAPLMIIGPTSSEVIDSFLINQAPQAESAVDLINQYQGWWSLSEGDFGYPIHWILGDVENDRWLEFDPLNNEVIIHEKLPQPIDDAIITAIPTKHTVPSCAWSIRTGDRVGKFDRERAKNLPLEVKNKLGKGEDVEFEGETLLADEFRGEPRKGQHLIISGDTLSNSISAEDVDVLVHESTFCDETQGLADSHLHSSARGAGKTATEITAKHLVLTHFSARFDDLSELQKQATAEHESVSYASDGDIISILEKGIVHKHLRDGDWMNTIG